MSQELGNALKDGDPEVVMVALKETGRLSNDELKQALIYALTRIAALERFVATLEGGAEDMLNNM